MASIFTTETPVNFAADQSVTIGTSFTVDANDYVATGARYYKLNAAYDGTTVQVALYDGATGSAVATGARQQTSSDPHGWITVNFTGTVAMSSATAYIVAYFSPGLGYTVDGDDLTSPINRTPFHTPSRAGRFSYGGAATYPDGSSNASYFADIVARSTSVTTTATAATVAAKALVPTVTRGVVDAPVAVVTAATFEPVVTSSRVLSGGGAATARAVAHPATVRERPTVYYVDNDGIPVFLLGWWDGDTLQQADVYGYWDGATVQDI